MIIPASIRCINNSIIRKLENPILRLLGTSVCCPLVHLSYLLSLLFMDVVILVLSLGVGVQSYTLKGILTFNSAASTVQGSKGIRQRPINLCKSLIMMHKITLSEDYNERFKRLDTQLNERTNQNSIKVPNNGYGIISVSLSIKIL